MTSKMKSWTVAAVVLTMTVATVCGTRCRVGEVLPAEEGLDGLPTDPPPADDCSLGGAECCFRTQVFHSAAVGGIASSELAQPPSTLYGCYPDKKCEAVAKDSALCYAFPDRAGGGARGRTCICSPSALGDECNAYFDPALNGGDAITTTLAPSSAPPLRQASLAFFALPFFLA